MEIESSFQSEQNPEYREHLLILDILSSFLDNKQSLYGELKHLLNLLRIKNPTYQILSFQFTENYMTQKSIMLSVQDRSTQEMKSLKVFFYDICFFGDWSNIFDLFEGQKCLLRNDLLIDVHDIYYLEQFGIKFFIVIEMELIYSTLNQLGESGVKYNQTDINTITDTCLKYLDDTKVIQKITQLSSSQSLFYVVKIAEDEQFRVKLNILESCCFFHEKTNINMSKQSKSWLDNFNKQKQSEIIDEDFMEEMNNITYFEDSDDQAYFLENDFHNYLKSLGINCFSVKQQLKEVSYHNSIHKDSFVSYIQKNVAQLLLNHPLEIFEALAQHPKYECFSLVEQGGNYFIIRVHSGNQELILKGEKFDGIQMAENKYKQYERYITTAKDLFEQISSYEIIAGGLYSYVLIEEWKINENVIIQQSELLKMKMFHQILLFLLLMKNILKVETFDLYDINICEWSLVVDSEGSPSFILYKNPLFMKNNLQGEFNNSIKKTYLQTGKAVLPFLKDLKTSIFNMINQSPKKYLWLRNLTEKIGFQNLAKNPKYQQNVLKEINSRISAIRRFQQIEKHEIQLNSNCCIKFTQQGEIDLQITHSDLIQSIKSGVLHQADNLSIINQRESLDIEFLEQFGFTQQFMSLQAFDFQLSNISCNHMMEAGLKHLLYLFPNLRKLKVSISYIEAKKQNIFFEIGGYIRHLRQLKKLEISLINVNTSSLRKEALQLHEDFKQITNLEFLHFQFVINPDDDHILDDQIKDIIQKSIGKGQLVVQKYQFQERFKHLGNSLRSFLEQDPYNYWIFFCFFSLVMHYYEVEISTEFSDDQKGSMILTLQHKSALYDELKIELILNEGIYYETKVVSQNKEFLCQTIMNNTDLEIILHFWIRSSVLKSEFQKDIGDKMEFFCKHGNHNQYQIYLYKNQKNIKTLRFTIKFCYYTLEHLRQYENYFQFTPLTNLRELYLDLDLVQSDLNDKFLYLLSLHLKRLKHLVYLSLLDVSYRQLQYKWPKYYFYKLKRLVRFCSSRIIN